MAGMRVPVDDQRNLARHQQIVGLTVINARQVLNRDGRLIATVPVARVGASPGACVVKPEPLGEPSLGSAMVWA